MLSGLPFYLVLLLLPLDLRLTVDALVAEAGQEGSNRTTGSYRVEGIPPACLLSNATHDGGASSAPPLETDQGGWQSDFPENGSGSQGLEVLL